MTQREKLIERIRARPPEAKARDVQALLDDFGWRLDRQHGSHLVFFKPGEGFLSITLAGGRTVKRTYLDIICKRLGLDD